MINHRTYRKHQRLKSKHFFSNKTGKKPLWIDRRIERHARIIAVLFFVGIGLTYAIGIKTLATWDSISRIFFALAIVTYFIPNRFFPLLYRFKKELKILFSIFGLSPLLTGLILLINFTFIHDIGVESYKVQNVIRYHNDYMFKVELENDEMQKFTQLRTFSSDEFKFYPDSAHYQTGKGCFRFKVVRKAYLTQ